MKVKLIVEIDEELYNAVKGSDYEFEKSLTAIAHGTPYNEADKWISVKDKLPDKEGKCLVFTDYGDVTMDSFVDGMFVCNLGNVTHWRPLPKAPESEAENETDI